MPLSDDETRAGKNREMRGHSILRNGHKAGEFPGGDASGSCFTSGRNACSRVAWASAASERMACSSSIYRDTQIYYFLSSAPVLREILEISFDLRAERDDDRYMKIDDAAARLEALGNPTRLRYTVLWSAPARPACRSAVCRTS